MNCKSSKGSVLIEFVIALPIMLFLVFAIVDLSVYFRNKHIVNNLAASGLYIPIALIQQKINTSYQEGNPIDDFSSEEIFKKSSSVIFNICKTMLNSTNVNMSCYWSVFKKEKDSDGNDIVKFLQKKIDHEGGGSSAASSITNSSIDTGMIDSSGVIILEFFVDYRDDSELYIGNFNFLKNFKSLHRRIIDDNIKIPNSFYADEIE